MSTTGRIISYVFTGLILAFIIVIASHMYKVKEEVETGLQGEAATFPLLAAERFLKRMGISVARIDNPEQMDSLPGPNDALLITSDRQTVGIEMTHRLLDWVENGGRLVVTIPYLDDEELSQPRDPLLEALDLRVVETDCASEAGFSDIDLPWANDILRIEFGYCLALSGAQKTDEVSGDEEGTQIIRRHLGAGTVTIVSDLDFLSWLSLGDYDHAQALWHLIDGRGKVWLVTSNDMPSLMQWLIENAPFMLVSALLLMFTWLWRIRYRFGPTLPNPEPLRRRIMEHIEASGTYLWKTHHRSPLVDAVRNDVLNTAALRHPGWSAMNRADREAHIAELTGLTVEASRRLLDGYQPASRQEFTTLIRHLKTIKENL
jgi:hypothetical protein